jgi:endonuclease YncB( thermonuclease family)
MANKLDFSKQYFGNSYYDNDFSYTLTEAQKKRAHEANLKFFDTLKKPITSMSTPSHRSGLDRVLDALSMPLYATAGAVKGGLSSDKTALQGVYEGIKAGNPFGAGFEEGEVTYSQVLGELGWEPTSTGGKVAKGVAGFALDVLLDPLTYMTFGTGSLIRGSGRAGIKATHDIAFLAKTIGDDVYRAEYKVAKEALHTDDVAHGIASAKSSIISDEFLKSGMMTPNVARSIVSANGMVAEKDLLTAAQKFSDGYNKIIGIRKNRDVTIGLMNIPFVGEKKFAGMGITLTKASTIEKVTDKIFGTAYSKIRDGIYGSKLGKNFGKNTILYQMSKTDPSSVYNLLREVQASKKLGGVVATQKNTIRGILQKHNLSPAEQKQVISQLEDKQLWHRVSSDIFDYEEKKLAEGKALIEANYAEAKTHLDSLVNAKNAVEEGRKELANLSSAPDHSLALQAKAEMDNLEQVIIGVLAKADVNKVSTDNGTLINMLEDAIRSTKNLSDNAIKQADNLVIKAENDVIKSADDVIDLPLFDIQKQNLPLKRELKASVSEYLKLKQDSQFASAAVNDLLEGYQKRSLAALKKGGMLSTDVAPRFKDNVVKVPYVLKNLYSDSLESIAKQFGTDLSALDLSTLKTANFTVGNAVTKNEKVVINSTHFADFAESLLDPIIVHYEKDGQQLVGVTVDHPFFVGGKDKALVDVPEEELASILGGFKKLSSHILSDVNTMKVVEGSLVGEAHPYLGENIVKTISKALYGKDDFIKYIPNSPDFDKFVQDISKAIGRTVNVKEAEAIVASHPEYVMPWLSDSQKVLSNLFPHPPAGTSVATPEQLFSISQAQKKLTLETAAEYRSRSSDLVGISEKLQAMLLKLDHEFLVHYGHTSEYEAVSAAHADVEKLVTDLQGTLRKTEALQRATTLQPDKATMTFDPTVSNTVSKNTTPYVGEISDDLPIVQAPLFNDYYEELTTISKFNIRDAVEIQAELKTLYNESNKINKILPTGIGIYTPEKKRAYQDYKSIRSSVATRITEHLNAVKDRALQLEEHANVLESRITDDAENFLDKTSSLVAQQKQNELNYNVSMQVIKDVYNRDGQEAVYNVLTRLQNSSADDVINKLRMTYEDPDNIRSVRSRNEFARTPLRSNDEYPGGDFINLSDDELIFDDLLVYMNAERFPNLNAVDEFVGGSAKDNLASYAKNISSGKSFDEFKISKAHRVFGDMENNGKIVPGSTRQLRGNDAKNFLDSFSPEWNKAFYDEVRAVATEKFPTFKSYRSLSEGQRSIVISTASKNMKYADRGMTYQQFYNRIDRYGVEGDRIPGTLGSTAGEDNHIRALIPYDMVRYTTGAFKDVDGTWKQSLYEFRKPNGSFGKAPIRYGAKPPAHYTRTVIEPLNNPRLIQEYESSARDFAVNGVIDEITAIMDESLPGKAYAELSTSQLDMLHKRALTNNYLPLGSSRPRYLFDYNKDAVSLEAGIEKVKSKQKSLSNKQVVQKDIDVLDEVLKAARNGRVKKEVHVGDSVSTIHGDSGIVQEVDEILGNSILTLDNVDGANNAVNKIVAGSAVDRIRKSADIQSTLDTSAIARSIVGPVSAIVEKFGGLMDDFVALNKKAEQASNEAAFLLKHPDIPDEVMDSAVNEVNKLQSLLDNEKDMMNFLGLTRKYSSSDAGKYVFETDPSISVSDRIRGAVMDLREAFVESAKDRVALSGKAFAEESFDLSIPHILTPEGKELIKNNPFVSKLFEDTHIANTHNALSPVRTVKNIVLDGVEVKNPTISQMNEYFSKYLQGKNAFVDNLSDMFVATSTKSSDIMYSSSYYNEMSNIFGKQYRLGDDVTDRNLFIPMDKLKNIANQMATWAVAKARSDEFKRFAQANEGRIQSEVGSKKAFATASEFTRAVDEAVRKEASEYLSSDDFSKQIKTLKDGIVKAVIGDNLDDVSFPLIKMSVDESYDIMSMFDSAKLEYEGLLRTRATSMLPNTLPFSSTTSLDDLSALLAKSPDVNAEQFKAFTRQYNQYKMSFAEAPISSMHNSVYDKLKDVRQAYQIQDNNGFLGLYDKFTTFIKLNQTAVMPAFHVRNKLSNMYLNWLEIGNDAFKPEFQKAAWKTVGSNGLDDGGHMLTLFDGNKIPWKEVYDSAVKNGVINEGYFAKDVGTGSIGTGLLPDSMRKVDPTNMGSFVPYQIGMKVGTHIENQDRLIHYASQLSRGLSEEDAASSVEHFLFNYSDLTSFEQNVMKRIIPYYTWLRNNVPLQLETLITHPEKMLFVSKVYHGFEGMSTDGDQMEEGWMSDFALDWLKLPFTYTTTDQYGNEHTKRTVLNPAMPFMDISRIPSPFQPIDSLIDTINQMNPLIKTPIEQFANYDTFKKQPIVDKTYNKETKEYEYESNANRLKNILSQNGPYSTLAKIATSDNPLEFVLNTVASAGVRVSLYDYDAYKSYKMGTIIDKGYSKLPSLSDTVSTIVSGFGNALSIARPLRADEYQGALRPISSARYDSLDESEKELYIPPSINETIAYNKEAYTLSEQEYAKEGKFKRFVWSLLDGFELGDRSQNFAMGSVTSVIDGDTFSVKIGDTEQKVRLLLIDTPESVGTTLMPYGMTAKDYSTSALIDKDVKLYFDGETRYDKYGRLLAYVEVDGEDLGSKLLYEGLAKYRYNTEGESYRNAVPYFAKQLSPRSTSKGIWGINGYSSLFDEPYSFGSK